MNACFAAAADLRIINSDGELANMGLMQVRTDLGFGSVCGMNDGAANVACRLLGYDYGAVGSKSCSSYGGFSMCGAFRGQGRCRLSRRLGVDSARDDYWRVS